TPDDLTPCTIGSGERQSELPDQPDHFEETVKRVASKGYVRSNLRVLPGGNTGRAVSGYALASTGTDARAATSHGHAHAHVRAESLAVVGAAAGYGVDSKRDQIMEARAKGYVGDACGECGNMTLVRNGTCLKCETCGSTTGCS
ncbi:MAG: vitamin B12-dependent ribonucleotide reductase, partial [Rhodospirillaceae bacterium]